MRCRHRRISGPTGLLCPYSSVVALSRLLSSGVATVHRMSSLHPLVFSGPSGSGKSTLVQRLMKEYSGCFAFSVSRKSLLLCMFNFDVY